MKVNCRIAAFVLLTWPGISGSAGIMASSSESANNQMISYNVVWDSPSTNAMGSMPLGNGDIALNVWAEEGGDLWCYIAKADAWDGGNNLIKAGCVRFSLNPNPFSKGRPFRQELKLAQGEIVIQAGQGDSAVTMRIWVDANHPVIHLESESKTLFSMRASVEMPWRTGDVFLPAEKNRVAWYHRNTNSSWSAWMKQQGLESLIPKLSDPLLNRTFGALMKGKGMVNDGNQALKSNKPQSSYAIALYPFTRQTASVEEWASEMERQISQIDEAAIQKAYQDHRKWWQSFWDRSWIHVAAAGREKAGTDSSMSATNSAEFFISQGYALQRFKNACAGRGAYPIKFNGSLFTFQCHKTGDLSFDRRLPENPDPDFRAWGGCYWFQNTRLIYWPMPAGGDYDLMLPLFNMYLRNLPLAQARTKLYYKHAGAFFPETQTFWGIHRADDVICAVNSTNRTPVINPYVRYYWQGGLELTAMMLDYYDHTQNQDFLKVTLLPLATDIVCFYDKHYQRGVDGKILISPSQSLETWHVAENPLPEIAGLRYVLDRLQQLPSSAVTQVQREDWKRIRNELPALPCTKIGGEPVLLIPADSCAMLKNSENPELYAIFPYRLYGVGKPGLEVAQRTFARRRFPNYGCWGQCAIQSACLGDAQKARYLCDVYFIKQRSRYARFPAFWGPGQDWIPDEDHGGVGMMTLQMMLLQSNGDRILLFPAWPKEWNVAFKLHAPKQTVVEGVLKDGKVERLKVMPKEREKDVVIMAVQ